MTISTLLFFILGIALISYGANVLVTSTQNISEKYNIMYFDITDISREAESDTTLLANDKLHPSKKMYEMWVEKLKYQLIDSLKNS